MMAAISHRNTLNPLLLPEIVKLVVDNVHMAPDLLSCACVNNIWNVEALKKLYKGSLNDMQFRTPDIGSLNCLFVASRKRFAQNMGFVKHLLLSPETPAIDKLRHRKTRFACFQKCRAMRHRQYAELLLRPRGRGPASLTIPFEIVDQDWSLISELLLTPTVEFLAIDNHYCQLLMASSSYSQLLIAPADKFSNLKALTIYKLDSDQEIDGLCRLLKNCDLQFFHLEDQHRGNLTQSDTVELNAELLPRLRQQQNLKALALIIPHCGTPLGSVSTKLVREEQDSPWPRLKALYLQEGDQHWLEQLPKFEELQILSLRRLAVRGLAPVVPTINRSAIEKIAKCRHLRVIDLRFRELDDFEALLDIAHGCPLLQKFSVGHIPSWGKQKLAEDLFLGLLRALPRLEFLKLGLKFRMDGAKLQDLTRHCPRLTVLELPETILYLSLALMTKAHPLQQLESMCFRDIWFDNPRRLMQRDKIQSISTEWRRIFPKLRGMPCPVDIYHMEEDDLSEESEGDGASVSAGEEMSPSEPRLDIDDHDPDGFILRRKLWRIFGYEKDQLIHDKIQNMWQTNLEIETIGWPVVPLKAFYDPDPHSTTAYGRYGRSRRLEA